jgi:hypothetical protein
MDGKRIMLHELGRKLSCEIIRQAALDVDGGQLGTFKLGIFRQFLPLTGYVRRQGFRLRADRDVLAGGHRHSAGNQPGKASDKHGLSRTVGSGDSDDQAGSRQQSVIGTEYGRPQPAKTRSGMAFVNPW